MKRLLLLAACLSLVLPTWGQDHESELYWRSLLLSYYPAPKSGPSRSESLLAILEENQITKPEWRGDLFVRLAEMGYSAFEKANRLEFYEQALEANPQSLEALFGISMSNLYSEQLPQYLDSWIAVDSENSLPIFLKAFYKANRQDYSGALAFLQRGNRINQAHYRSLYSRLIRYEVFLQNEDLYRRTATEAVYLIQFAPRLAKLASAFKGREKETLNYDTRTFLAECSQMHNVLARATPLIEKSLAMNCMLARKRISEMLGRRIHLPVQMREDLEQKRELYQVLGTKYIQLDRQNPVRAFSDRQAEWQADLTRLK